MRTFCRSRPTIQRSLLAALCLLAGCSDASPEPADLPSGSSIWPERVVTAETEESDNPWLRDFGVDGAGGTAAGMQRDRAGGEGELGTDASPLGGSDSPPPRWAVFRAYVETTSSAKALVIDEPGGAPLAGCRVVIFSNGGVTPYRTFELMSSAARVVLCIGDPGFICDDVRTGNGFNGDDAVTLECDGALRDVLGQVGVDPGDAWSGTGADGSALSTKDQALWRCKHPEKEASTFTWPEWMRWSPASAPLPDGPSCPTPDNGAAGASGG